MTDRTHRPPREVAQGHLLEDVALGAAELARALALEERWVHERVEAGLLVCSAGAGRFASVELVRARRLYAIERGFDANPELAAFAVDLIEEVERLRRRLDGRG